MRHAVRWALLGIAMAVPYFVYRGFENCLECRSGDAGACRAMTLRAPAWKTHPGR